MGKIMIERRISFSQYQMWKTCPHKWKLNYVDKIPASKPSIALVFGTAMHETLQYYVKTIHEKSIKEADSLNLNDMLIDTMRKEYAKLLLENDNSHFSNNDEMNEHYYDGVQIIKWLKSKRSEFFQKKDYELIGIELPINIVPLESHPTVNLVGFLDLVIKDLRTETIYIYDFKTSTKGWNSYAKNDKVKVSQLVLYKTYYAQQYNVPHENVVVEYLILKRKIPENAEYASMKNRVQRFEPSHGKVSQNFIKKEIKQFIEYNFTSNGEYNKDSVQLPISGNNFSNCRFCGYNDDEINCPKENRKNL
jgi:hypothetical protein